MEPVEEERVVPTESLETLIGSERRLFGTQLGEVRHRWPLISDSVHCLSHAPTADLHHHHVLSPGHGQDLSACLGAERRNGSSSELFPVAQEP